MNKESSTCNEGVTSEQELIGVPEVLKTVDKNFAIKENDKSSYLKEFKRENMALDFFGKPKLDEVGLKVLNLLKKEDLTNEQAYASLQYVYNLIKYESNFLKLS